MTTASDRPNGTNDNPRKISWLLPASADLARAAPTFRNRALLLMAATSRRTDWSARTRDSASERLTAATSAVAALVALLGDLDHVALIGRRLSEDPGLRAKANGSPDLSNRGDKPIREFIANAESELRHLTGICEALARRVSVNHQSVTPRVLLRSAKAIDTATDARLAAAHALINYGPGPDPELRGSLLGTYAIGKRGRRVVLESSRSELDRLRGAQRRRRASVRRDLGEWEPVPDEKLLESLQRSQKRGR